MRTLPLFVTAAILALGIAAQAAPPPGAIMRVQPPGVPTPAEIAKFCASRLAMQGQALDAIAVKLSLTPAQKPLFAAWKEARLEVVKSQPCPPVRFPPVMSQLDRLNRIEPLIRLKLDGVRKEKPSITALYKALTPKQQAIFDPLSVDTPRPAGATTAR